MQRIINIALSVLISLFNLIHSTYLNPDNVAAYEEIRKQIHPPGVAVFAALKIVLQVQTQTWSLEAIFNFAFNEKNATRCTF